MRPSISAILARARCGGEDLTFDSADVKQIHADEEALVPIGVTDPVAGVYSPTFGQKGAVLNQ